MSKRFVLAVVATASLLACVAAAVWPDLARSGPVAAARGPLFETSQSCMACHNGLVTPAGEDVSIGSAWRGSMMANSARDPYWQASVRREILDHPLARETIEDECSKCHMPMAQFEASASGRTGQIFAHLPVGAGAARADLAADGVSCTACHQITAEHLGEPASFSGHFAIDTTRVSGQRHIFGPFPIDDGRAAVMHSATGFQQVQSSHIQKSELCATCHTLHTHALGPRGETIGSLPEQVPFQEWQHSSYRNEKTCQDCHMPAVDAEMPIASVLGQPRAGLSRHDFRGSNAFMLQMLNRFRTELGVEASPQELDLAVWKARQLLQEETARVSIERTEVASGRLAAEVAIVSRVGHKLPSAYPSRRVWLHFMVRDAGGRVVFDSGALSPTGRIHGNDNDADPVRYEPHYDEIRSAEEVQIYESILVDAADAVTTGLLSGLRYVKDNRLLPRGFDKNTAGSDVAVHGTAATDPDFVGGGDRIRYVVDVTGARGPFVVEAVLWYQSIGYRWAENLRGYDAVETERFVRYYEAMAPASGTALARDRATVTVSTTRD